MEHGCGSNGGHCGCSGKSSDIVAASPADNGSIATINGVLLHPPRQRPDEETLRQWACTELLRQQAQARGLLAADDINTGDGTTSEAATQAIEQLLEQELKIPGPSEEACRRYYDANPTHYAQGQRARLRHILFAVTPGVDVQALRKHAEGLLIELRCADPASAEFARAAAKWSNCPSGEQGGDLDWIGTDDSVPEFSREIFCGQAEIGVLPRLVHSRHGLHVVEVQEREAGMLPEFEQVRASVAHTLQQQAWINALRQYLQVLAGAASLEGITLDATDSPLVQ